MDNQTIGDAGEYFVVFHLILRGLSTALMNLCSYGMLIMGRVIAICNGLNFRNSISPTMFAIALRMGEITS